MLSGLTTYSISVSFFISHFWPLPHFGPLNLIWVLPSISPLRMSKGKGLV